MRLSLHKKPSFLPSTVPTPAQRARGSLPPRPARRLRWLFIVAAASMISATVAVAANRVSKSEAENEGAGARVGVAAEGAAARRAEAGTRALLDERLHVHLKRLSTR